MEFSLYSKALAIVPKCSGLLSFIGSISIIQDVIKDKEKRSASVFHRIMLGLSLFDAMASVVNILSTWPTPANLSESVFLASGTTVTCTLQGFFNELGNITTIIYTTSLCLRYLLFVKYGWKERDFQKHELMFHVLPIATGLAMAIVGLPLQLYNNAGYLCWYAPAPKNCEEFGTCSRGRLMSSFRWIHYGIVWSAIVLVTLGMILLYTTVRKQEVSTTTLGTNQRKMSKAVAAQAAWYIFALYITWLFTTITRVYSTVYEKTNKTSLMLMALFFPLQGFWNAFIYYRPQLIRNRNREGVRTQQNSNTKVSLRNINAQSSIKISKIAVNQK